MYKSLEQQKGLMYFKISTSRRFVLDRSTLFSLIMFLSSSLQYLQSRHYSAFSADILFSLIILFIVIFLAFQNFLYWKSGPSYTSYPLTCGISYSVNENLAVRSGSDILKLLKQTWLKLQS